MPSTTGLRVWKVLAGHMEMISAHATELGEPKYDFKYVNMRSRLMIRDYIAIQYAVSEERALVLVQKISLSGKHPFPQEIDEILNSKG